MIECNINHLSNYCMSKYHEVMISWYAYLYSIGKEINTIQHGSSTVDPEFDFLAHGTSCTQEVHFSDCCI